MSQSQTDTHVTIPITGRRPVIIAKEEWPVIARARAKDWDGQHECQANRTAVLTLTARGHADGRCIVYATHDYTTAFQGERNLYLRHGVLCSSADVEDKIADVAASMLADTGDDHWRAVGRECLTSLEPETL